MRPDRKEAAPENERMRQEVDGLLATSQRLLAEMQALVERAKQLAARHIEAVRGSKRRK